MAHGAEHGLIDLLDQLAGFGIEAVNAHAGKSESRHGPPSRAAICLRPDKAAGQKRVWCLVMIDRGRRLP